MAALDDATVTIDTGEMVYIDRRGQSHTVTNAQTFVLELATGVIFNAASAGNRLTCTDGTDLRVLSYPVFTRFIVTADATAETNVGSIWFRENDGHQAEWRIRSATIDDVDEPTVITSMVLERADKPIHTMTLTSVTVAQ